MLMKEKPPTKDTWVTKKDLKKLILGNLDFNYRTKVKWVKIKGSNSSRDQGLWDHDKENIRSIDKGPWYENF